MKKRKKKPVLLNIGCGETKLEGYINIDLEKKVKPDMVIDVKSQLLPFKPGTVDQINCIHNLEHIEQKYWPFVFKNFYRVLKPKAALILAYPEFSRCAKNFLTNHRGLRDFWRATLYGRQLYPGDYHVVPMVTKEVCDYLLANGFDDIKYCPEADEPYNTFLRARKGKIITREQVVKKEVFGK